MTSSGPDAHSGAQTIRAKYLEERDKRLVEGRARIRDLRQDAVFARYREDPFTPIRLRDPVIEEVDVAIIGAGMAGIVAGAELRKAGLQNIRLIDEAGGVGGTWYWNRYPGVMCDVESYIYMPMLEELDYVPTRKYAFGDEIRRHFEGIAKKFDLVDGALLHTRVERSEWDEEQGRWVVRTDRGDELHARYLIMAVGILNLMKLPALPGMEDFKGKSFHTARWDYGYTGGQQEVLPPVYGGSEEGKLSKLADKTVAVIGTGASAIQCIPPLAESAKRLLVFQRTPSAIGARNNRPTGDDVLSSVRAGWQRERMLNFQSVLRGLPAVTDMVDDGWTHYYGPNSRAPQEPGLSVEEMIARGEELDYEIMEEHRGRIDQIVKDRKVADALKPYYRYLCKRPCFHDEYYPTFNRENVTLVECPSGIDRICEKGVIVGGQLYETDCIIYATGFEAETTPLGRRAGHQIIGRNGADLGEKWAKSVSSLFGMMTRGFPNLFIMPAPGQQAVLTVNHTLITVLGAEHIGQTVAILEARNIKRFDVSEEAERAWVKSITDKFVDASDVLSACTPSRKNFEGNVGEELLPENGHYGGGLGDLFGFLDVLARWLGELGGGEAAGLELDEDLMHA